METKDLIKQKLKENLIPHKRQTVMFGLLNKCANSLYDAYRSLESSLQYCDDPEIRKKLESVKMMLGHEIEIDGSFSDGKSSAITNIQKVLDDEQNLAQ